MLAKSGGFKSLEEMLEFLWFLAYRYSSRFVDN